MVLYGKYLITCLVKNDTMLLRLVDMNSNKVLNKVHTTFNNNSELFNYYHSYVQFINKINMGV